MANRFRIRWTSRSVTISHSFDQFRFLSLSSRQNFDHLVRVHCALTRKVVNNNRRMWRVDANYVQTFSSAFVRPSNRSERNAIKYGSLHGRLDQCLVKIKSHIRKSSGKLRHLISSAVGHILCNMSNACAVPALVDQKISDAFACQTRSIAITKNETASGRYRNIPARDSTVHTKPNMAHWRYCNITALTYICIYHRK